MNNFLNINPAFNNFLKNVIFLILILITLSIPIVSWGSFFVFSLTLVIIFLGKITFDRNKIIIATLLALISLILQVSLPNKIEEGFLIYPTEENEFLNKEIPNKINLFMKKTIDENYSIEVPFADSGWSFSADGIWQKKSMSRLINDINFNNVHELRIGAYNDYNKQIDFKNWSPYKLRLPLLIKYILPNKFHNAKFCFQGLVYVENDFILNKEIQCKKLNLGSLEIYAFDLEPLPELKIQLISHDFTFKIEKFLKFFNPILALLIIFLLGRISITFVSFLLFGFIGYFVYLIDIVLNEDLPSKFSTFVYMARGNDGLYHYGFGREIVKNLFESNFIMALRGGADVFHFMPGLRYFHSLSMILFGETLLGYVLIGLLLPYIIFALLKKFFSFKCSMVLTFIFLVFPIFESFGFFHFYYMKLIAKGFGGTLGWTSLFIAILLLLSTNKNHFSKDFLMSFIAGISLIISVFCRPNILPTVFILIIGFSLLYLFQANKTKLFGLILGSLNFFWLSIHNFYFGSEFHLITNSSATQKNMPVTPDMWLSLIQSIFNNSINLNLFYTLLNHISIWINYFEVWLMICILSLFAILISKTVNFEKKIISISLLAGHSIYIFYAGVPRYTYGLWLLSLVMMLMYFNEHKKLNQIISKLYLNIKKNFK